MRQAQLLATALAAIILAGPATAQRIGFSLLTAERLWDLARLGQPSVSPDEKHVVFTVATFPRGTDSPAIDLWLANADGRGEPRQLTRNPGPDFDPTWMLDGSAIVYSSARGGDSADLFLLPLRGGEPQLIADFPTGTRSPRVRADTGTIVFEAETYPDINADVEALTLRLAAEERVDERAIATESRVIRRHGRPISPRRVAHLFEVDPETGAIVDLMPGFAQSVGIAPFEWDLSPDGRFAAFTAVAAAAPFASRDRDVYLLDLHERQLINLTTGRPGSAFAPVFGSDANLIFGETPTPDALAENTRLVRLQLGRNELEVITDPAVHSPDFWRLDPTGRHLYYGAEQDGARHVFRAGIGGGRGRLVVKGGDVSSLDIGASGDLYFLLSNFTQPPALQRTDDNGNHQRQLTFLNQPLLEDTRLGSAREIHFAGHEGAQIHGFLGLPPGFDADHTWPVIVLLHGGPHDAWLERFNFRWNLLLFASPGYLVAAINPHGSTGYGQEFARAAVGAPLEPAAADIMAALRYLTSLPYVDPQRIAVAGGSYGGYLANWLLAHTDRFRTAVVHAGVYDLMVQYASDYPWGRDRTYGALPWEAPERYRLLSPSTYADRVATPVLLLHGERDTRVPVAHSLMQHNILTGRGVRSRLVLFPGEGHQIDSRLAAERWWAEVFDWLRDHAPPGPLPR